MAKLVCKIVGIISFLAGSVVLIVGTHVDRYHFLFHVVWGVIAIGFGFLGLAVSGENLLFSLWGCVLGARGARILPWRPGDEPRLADWSDAPDVSRPRTPHDTRRWINRCWNGDEDQLEEPRQRITNRWTRPAGACFVT